MPRAKAAKKVSGRATKKASPRTPGAKRRLVVAEGEACFWVHEGPILKDLRELHMALESAISEAQFKHHTSSGKNDFAAWVKSVLGDLDCARTLARAKTRAAARKIVGDHLKKHY